MSPIVKKLRSPLGHPLFYLVILLSLSLLGISCLGDFERDNPLDPKSELAATATPDADPTNTPVPPPPGWLDRGQMDDTGNNNEAVVDTNRYPGVAPTLTGNFAGYWTTMSSGQSGKCMTKCSMATISFCDNFDNYYSPAGYTGGIGAGLLMGGDFCNATTMNMMSFRCVIAGTVVGNYLNVSRYTGIEFWWKQNVYNPNVTVRANELILATVASPPAQPPVAWQKRQVPFTSLSVAWNDTTRYVDWVGIRTAGVAGGSFIFYLDELRFY